MTSQFKMFSETWMGTPTKQIQQHDAAEFVWKILNQYDKDATVVMGNFQIDTASDFYLSLFQRCSNAGRFTAWYIFLQYWPIWNVSANEVTICCQASPVLILHFSRNNKAQIPSLTPVSIS